VGVTCLWVTKWSGGVTSNPLSIKRHEKRREEHTFIGLDARDCEHMANTINFWNKKRKKKGFSAFI
jgi:hypothetical protein